MSVESFSGGPSGESVMPRRPLAPVTVHGLAVGSGNAAAGNSTSSEVWESRKSPMIMTGFRHSSARWNASCARSTASCADAGASTMKR